jgi:hypothetical protein
MMDSLRKIEAIRAAQPNLTRWGFWLESRDGFDVARHEMASEGGIEEFERALLFIAACEYRKSVSKFSSYGWKHRAESWFRATRGNREYVSNGMFIAAALSMGLPMERILGVRKLPARDLETILGFGGPRGQKCVTFAERSRGKGDALGVVVTHIS